MVVSSPAIASGMVYIGSYDHMFYALGSSRNVQTYSAPFPILVTLVSGVIAVVAILLAAVLHRTKHKK